MVDRPPFLELWECNRDDALKVVTKCAHEIAMATTDARRFNRAITGLLSDLCGLLQPKTINGEIAEAMVNSLEREMRERAEEQNPPTAMLRAARQRLGLTQKQLAELAGVSHPYVSNAETGAYVPWKAVEKIVEALRFEASNR